MTTPFRWTVSRREQLGSLLQQAPQTDPRAHGLLRELRLASARILAIADDADLAFIGRTPENFYDYLSGIFTDIADAPALHLVQFSLRWAGERGVAALPPHTLSAFMDYLAEEGLDAASISAGSRPVALVDFVAHGGTMRNFISVLHLQAERQDVDWNAVQRRLRIIGLRVRTHNSPNTWRWQQHQDWLDLIPDTDIKNVSAPARLLWHIANDQPKLTRHFHPGRWGEGEAGARPITPDQQQALALAVALYDAGSTRAERLRLARHIAQQQAQMRQPATRRIVSRLKGL